MNCNLTHQPLTCILLPNSTSYTIYNDIPSCRDMLLMLNHRDGGRCLVPCTQSFRLTVSVSMGSVCRAAAAAAAMAAEGSADSLECLVCKRGDRESLPREERTLAIVVPLATEVTIRLDPSFRVDGVSPARLELLLLTIPTSNPLWLPFPPVGVGLEPRNSETCKWMETSQNNLFGL